MNRNEKELVLCVAVFVLGFAAAEVFGLPDVLGRYGWFSNGSNLIQWISGPGLLIGIGVGLWTRWHRSCAVPWCFRLGEHPVEGTLHKVCRQHHTERHHAVVRGLHAEAHRLSERLGWKDDPRA